MVSGAWPVLLLRYQFVFVNTCGVTCGHLSKYIHVVNEI